MVKGFGVCRVEAQAGEVGGLLVVQQEERPIVATLDGDGIDRRQALPLRGGAYLRTVVR